MYTVELPDFLVQCPTYWVNFITHLSIKHKEEDVPVCELKEALKEYNATWLEQRMGDDIEHCAVIFKTEADATWFKLKWQ